MAKPSNFLICFKNTRPSGLYLTYNLKSLHLLTGLKNNPNKIFKSKEADMLCKTSTFRPAIFIFLTIFSLLVQLVFARITLASSQTQSTKILSMESFEKKKAELLKGYGRVPLYFVRNSGQVDPKVKFYEKGRGHSIFFAQDGIYMSLVKGSRQKVEHGTSFDKTETPLKAPENGAAGDTNTQKPEIIKLIPLGANEKVKITAQARQQAKFNYFTGNKPEKWQTGVPAFGAVVYQEIYPGIDLKFYGTNQQLEYDIIVKPGGDPSVVRFRYEGIQSLEVTAEGNLAIQLSDNREIIQKKPLIYQEAGGKRVEIAGRFKIFSPEPGSTASNVEYGFDFASYDPDLALIIDPVLVYSTYLETSGGTWYYGGYDIDIDSNGNAYITGVVNSPDFPTVDPVQENFGGSSDAFVVKMNLEGSGFIYATYIGGSSFDLGHGIAVDPSGNAYVTGLTRSENFPLKNPLQGQYGYVDKAFVVKISSSGSELIYSTYLGGEDINEGNGIDVDNNGNAYITGYTRSDNFPTVNPIQNANGGYDDAFVTKINPSGSSIIYSTYVGGSDWETGEDIVVDADGNAYITGKTSSGDFPLKAALQAELSGGSWDAFVVKVNASGSDFIYSTYIGGSNDDIAHGVAVDHSGNVWVVGETNSFDFPMQNPKIGTKQYAESEAFVAKLNPAGSALEFSTYLKGTEAFDDCAYDVAVDTIGNAYVTGITSADDFPLKDPMQADNAGGSGDAFVTAFNPDGSAYLYSTYLGGSGEDGGMGIAVDSMGNVHVVGRTDSTNFPTEDPAFGSNQLGYNGFTAKITTILDTDSPSVQIVSPQNNATLDKLYLIEGTAADPTTIVTKVELQVTDGTDYLNQNREFVSTPTWVTADGTDNWSFNTSTAPWAPETTYSIKARSFDMLGNISPEASISVNLSIGQAYTTLSLALSSQTILNDGTIDAVGKLTRLPDTGTDLIGLPIKITVTAPDQTSTVLDTSTYDTYGHYQLVDVSGFNLPGMYTVKASFGGQEWLHASESEERALLVGVSAGYAIIVQGKITGAEGLASHGKTTRRIYQHLKERGFVDDNIYYFNHAYDPNPSYNPDGVDAAPSKSDIRDKIENWAPDRINGSPAPFYVIMVDHGNRDIFYVDGAEDTITPGDLNAWLNLMESRLSAGALAQKRIVIIGACYSGSFIPALSKAGRVVVTSATGDEESYKGPMEPDEVRSGEFFMEEFFQKLRRGESFRDSFVYATEKTETYTQRDNSSIDSGSVFMDGAVQHPLLDDNADGFGSNFLSDGYGDGQVAGEIYLGIGPNYDTNASENPADILNVTETLYLGTAASSAVLWAKVNDDSRVDWVWAEIRPPSKILSSSGQKEQLDLVLERHFMSKNEAESRWETAYGNFTESGRYEVLYFVADNITKNIAPMKRSSVYRDKVENHPPSSFSLISPSDAGEQKTVLTFDWQDAADQDQGDAVTYNLIISADNLFNDVVFKKEEIPVSATFVDAAGGLEDLTTYYWKIEAVDSFGARTPSNEVRSFKTDNTNGVPGFIQGLVYSGLDHTGIDGASLTAGDGGANTTSLPNGYFIMAVPSGPTAISCTKTGYQVVSVPGVVVNPETYTEVNIMMLPEGAGPDIEAPTSSASPPGGTYPDSLPVTLTCSDTGGSGCSAVYYAFGDTEPTIGSQKYSVPIIIDSTTTLKFFATDQAGNSGPVNSETYTIFPVKGNVNGDDDLDLADAVLALQAVVGMNPDGIDLDADVNGDGDIGLEEAVYILQGISGLRQP